MARATAREYFKENRFFILIGVTSLIIVDVCQLCIPRVTKYAIDDLTYLRLADDRLLHYALAILGLALIIAGFRYIWRRCLIGTSRKIEKDLRRRFFDHLQTLDAAYFNQTRTGDLMARATNDINNIRMATGFGLVALTDAIFLGTAAIGFMAYIDVRLTVYSLLPMPLIVILTRFFSRHMHKKYLAVQAAFSNLTETVREHYAGIRVIKAFAREKAETEKFAAVSRSYIRENLGLVRVTGTFFPLMIFFTNLSTALVLYVGGHQTIMTTITTGDFVAFLSYLGLLTWPMMALGWVTNLIQRGRASLDRINQVLTTTPAVSDLPGARPLVTFDEAIVFEKVSFAYQRPTPPSEGRFGLEDISFTLPKGQTLCIVGPPGSGKTTLANLLLRRYDAHAGQITIDGRPLEDLPLADLWQQIGYMPQEPFLFSASIKENITFRPELSETDEQLILACRRAGLYDTIRESFADGFETITGEKGVVLSGGQKQRVALARVFYHQAPILLLDDPVSQVDMETAEFIMAALKAAAHGKTVIFISHRLTMARAADQILVLEKGRLTEAGTHDQLVQKNGYYARVWGLQQLEKGPDE